MTEETPDRYDISSLPRPGSPEMPSLPSREPMGKADYRPSRIFGPYATEWISSDWSPLRKGRPTGRTARPSKYLNRPVGTPLVESRTPQEQISDRRKEFKAKLATILDTIKVAATSPLHSSRVPDLKLQANEIQFRIDELDVMQHFWPSITWDHKGELVDSDFVNEASKARAALAKRRTARVKIPKDQRFALPGETATLASGVRPTNALERGEDDSYWEQDGN